MSTKDFCDECNKEIIENETYYDLDFRGRTWQSVTYCASCFQKHWQGPLPKEKE